MSLESLKDYTTHWSATFLSLWV